MSLGLGSRWDVDQSSAADVGRERLGLHSDRAGGGGGGGGGIQKQKEKAAPNRTEALSATERTSRLLYQHDL